MDSQDVIIREDSKVKVVLIRPELERVWMEVQRAKERLDSVLRFRSVLECVIRLNGSEVGSA